MVSSYGGFTGRLASALFLDVSWIGAVTGFFRHGACKMDVSLKRGALVLAAGRTCMEALKEASMRGSIDRGRRLGFPGCGMPVGYQATPFCQAANSVQAGLLGPHGSWVPPRSVLRWVWEVSPCESNGCRLFGKHPNVTKVLKGGYGGMQFRLLSCTSGFRPSPRILTLPRLFLPTATQGRG